MRITKAALLIFGLILIIGQAYAAEVVVIPSTQIITPGATFNINVSIDPQGTAIAGAQLNIAFNSSLIRVNSITEGNLFTQRGANTFFNDGTINNSTGTVINTFNAIIGRYNVTTLGNFIIINATVIGTYGTSGINLSNVKISDPNGNPVALNVSNGSVMLNRAPVLASIGNKTVNEGQFLTFTISASDADGDSLTYSATGLPTGATFTPSNRTFQWTPNYTQSGNYSTSLVATDGNNTVQENIVITVYNVNRAPTFTANPTNGSIYDESDTIQISVTANDPDNDILSYSIKLDGVQLSTSSSYNWITNFSNSGYHTINISVSDGITASNSTLTIYINNVYPRYDVNENGVIDVGDFTIIGQHFNEIVSIPYPRYDVNSDGVVDVLDITLTAQYFGEYT
ncbi:MAG: putative Ig domain-containing protein [Candidatus Methanoperedens sp.]|nr:putative Ig domain-containing protein [Candidatus Methanoperedens sp.]